MLSPSHLCLQLVRLKSPETWAYRGVELGFVFPRGGSGSFDPTVGTSRMGAGDVLILNGELSGKILATDPAELVFWFFSAQLEHMFPLLGCAEISRLHALTESLRSPRIYPANSPVAIECHRLLGEVPPRFDLDHRGHLLRVIATILTAEFRTVAPPRDGFGTAEAHITQIFEKLSVEEILNLSVGDLAHRFSCSRRHLNRLFNQYFGLSVAALRMEMRLLKAATLLRDPETKVINVAEDCGFNHLGLFNTCFKRRFGTTPSAWRRRSLTPLVPDCSGAPEAELANCRIRENGLCPWVTQSTEKPFAKRCATQKGTSGTTFADATPVPARNSTLPDNILSIVTKKPARSSAQPPRPQP